MTATAPRRTLLIFIGLALVAAGVAVYGRALGFGFVDFDDGLYVTANDTVRAGLTPHGIAWAFTTFHAGNWHPLTWLSHMLDCGIFGLAGWGHHLTSLVLHLAATLLFFAALVRMTGDVWPGAFAAAVFMLHPLRVESVVWIAERKDVLGAFFWMLTLVVYLLYAGRPASTLRYAAVIGSFALGLLAKPMLVTLPFVLLLLDFWPLGRIRLTAPPRGPLSLEGGWKSLHGPVREKLPLFALSAVSCVLTVLAQHRGGALKSLDQAPLAARLAGAPIACIRYIGMMLWPSDLAVHYPLNLHPSTGIGVLSAAAVAGLTVLALAQARRRPHVPVGWLWYLGTLIPVIGLVQVGSQALADRYTYIPMAGLLLLAARELKIPAPGPGARAWAAGALCALATVGLGAQSFRQVGYWRDSVTLFEHALDVRPADGLMHYELARVLEQSGRLDEAIVHYRETLRLRPGFREAHCRIGLYLLARGRPDEAIAEFRAELVRDPAHAAAQYGLGAALVARGEISDAVPHFEAAVHAQPFFPRAHCALGTARRALGQKREAVESLARGVESAPDDRECRVDLALALLDLGDMQGARANLRTVLAADPVNARARQGLAAIDARGAGPPDAGR